MPKKAFTPEAERMLRDLGLAVATYVREKGEKGKKAPKDIVVPICLLVADGDYCKGPLPDPWPRPFMVRIKPDVRPVPKPPTVKRPTARPGK
jgi:hypothetical protein